MDDISKFNKERWAELARSNVVFLAPIMGLWEEVGKNPDATPGTWEHFTSIAPPAFSIWTRYCPDDLRTDSTASEK
jgi:hypothetical protein